jgi:diketogulonate reductase-like aldo/keto reductase
MDLRSTVPLRSGNRIPVIGLGTWQLTKDTMDTTAYALHQGWPMIDTSGDYGTQPGIGQGIKKAGARRDSFYLVTKVEETDDAYQATRKNLAELRLDYADLMLIHRPPKSGAGEELWRGLIRAKEEGLTRDIGVSNYSIELIEQLIKATGEVPVVNQIEWSPFGHSEKMLHYTRENHITIQAYSPLTRGKRLDDETLQAVAVRYGKTPAQILLRWNLQLGIVPLPKANQREHLIEDIDIFDFKLSDDDMDKINGLNERYSALGELPYE